MNLIRERAQAVRIVSILAISLFTITAIPAHAQNTSAKKLFHDAEDLLEAGKVEEACTLFEESNRIEPRAATLIYIGRCKEKLGKLASALAAFQSALARVKDPKKRKIATNEAALLELRVSRLTISVTPEARVGGLAVSLNGQLINAADYSQPIPIDGGDYQVTASAPGYQRWSTSIHVTAESDKASVTVPALVRAMQMEVSAIQTMKDLQQSPSTSKSRSRAALKFTGYGFAGAGLLTMASIVITESSRSTMDYENQNMAIFAMGGVGTLLGVVMLYFAYPSRGQPATRRSGISIGKHKRREFTVGPQIGPGGGGGGAVLHLVW